MNKSIFTKKHYEAIAKVLNEARSNPYKPFCTYGSEGTSKIAIYNVSQKLACLFEEDNKNFSKTKFEEAIAKEETSKEEARQKWLVSEARKQLFKEEASNGNI